MGRHSTFVCLRALRSLARNGPRLEPGPPLYSRNKLGRVLEGLACRQKTQVYRGDLIVFPASDKVCIRAELLPTLDAAINHVFRNAVRLCGGWWQQAPAPQIKIR